MRLAILFYIILLIPIPGIISGQEGILVKDNYHGKSFKEFADYIGQNSNIRIFYDPAWTDSLYIIQEAQPSYLNDVLVSSFKNTDLQFVWINDDLIVSRNFKIRTELPDDFILILEDEGHLSDNQAIKAEVDSTLVLKGEEEREYKIVILGDPAEQNGTMATLSGKIKEAATGEPIVGAVVYVENLQKGTITDPNGFYRLSLPRDNHNITVHCMGFRDEHRQINVYSDGYLDFELQEQVTRLKEVVVTADRFQNVAGLQMGLNRLDINTVKEIPSSFGERDVMKTSLFLPGVKTVGEGATGFNVRGGSTDENLILFNNSPVFNSSHFFGFFSAFNPDIIKDFKLYKSGIPAEYGGRISSVMDINTKNGNKKNFSGSLGLGIITTRAMLEGPLIKNKCSMIISGRTTYSNWILRQIPNSDISNSKASFYDLTAKINYEINKKNSLSLIGYRSFDFFRLSQLTTYKYFNHNAGLQWKHTFNNRWIAQLETILSDYSYEITEEDKETTANRIKYHIQHKEVKGKFTWFPRFDHTVKFGFSSIFYGLSPGERSPFGEQSIISDLTLESEQASESALFIDDEYRIGPSLTVYGGLRYSLFFQYGPQWVSLYKEDIPLSTSTIYDSIFYPAGKLVKPVYRGPELRFSVRYKMGTLSSIKLSYNRMRQYLNMLSNTTAVSPTDIWKLSGPYIAPKIGDQISLGYYKDFSWKNLETSFEVYYKHLANVIEYKGDAKLMVNETIEADLLSGLGNAYGIEFMMRKPSGRLTGWINYTYSRIFLKVDSYFFEERINEGEYYPGNYDQPHELNLVSNYKFTRRLNLSNTYTWATGRPITYPVAKYTIRDITIMHYSNRNEYRIPDYMRWDISLNLEGNLKSRKIAHSSWSLSVYNVTGRRNVYSIFFTRDETRVVGNKLSVFARPVASLSYSIRF